MEGNRRQRPAEARAVGVDAGATLAKVAIRNTAGAPEKRLLPAKALPEIEELVVGLQPRRVGLAGGGAAALQEKLRLRGVESVRVDEFAAWGSGAAALLLEQAAEIQEPYLVVSLGTGTSVMLADGMSVSRIGGSALGGGTVLGLGSVLLGSSRFSDIAALAREGDRRKVDLLVSDIYRPGEIPLSADLTAANFGRLADREGSEWRPGDVAQGIMGLVGENVALICSVLALTRQIHRIVFGGSTLRQNAALRDVIEGVTRAFGHEAIFLEGGEFAGALGALRLAAGESG